MIDPRHEFRNFEDDAEEFLRDYLEDDQIRPEDVGDINDNNYVKVFVDLLDEIGELENASLDEELYGN